MTLRTQLEADAQNVFLIADETAEKIIYQPLNGRPRTVLAIIERGVPEGIPEVPGDSLADSFVVYVANDLTTGIRSEEIDTGGDVIKLPRRMGEDPTEYRISQLLDQDDGMLMLEVR